MYLLHNCLVCTITKDFFFLLPTLVDFSVGTPWWNSKYPDNIHSLYALQMRQPFVFIMEL